MIFNAAIIPAFFAAIASAVPVAPAKAATVDDISAQATFSDKYVFYTGDGGHGWPNGDS